MRKFTTEEIKRACESMNTLESLGCDVDIIGWSKFKNAECYIDYAVVSRKFIVVDK